MCRKPRLLLRRCRNRVRAVVAATSTMRSTISVVGTLISDSWVVVLPARRPRRVVRGLGCAFLYLSR